MWVELRKSGQGGTPVLAAAGGKLIALLCVADPPKEGSEAALSVMHELGLRTTMLTGWFLNPMLAAAAMSVSSLFVVTNSLRLRRFRPRVGQTA